MEGLKETVEEMSFAYDVEAPIPTRSQFAQIPIIGHVFQAACDVGDLVSVNAGFAVKYSAMVPWLVAAPAVAVAVPALASPVSTGFALTKSVLVSLIPLATSAIGAK
jgi:hypothetical protein